MPTLTRLSSGFSVFKGLLWLGLSLTFVTQAEGAAEKTTYVMCRSHKIVRTIRVVESPETCSTIYTKFGVDKVVGGGKNQQSCYDMMKNIRTNLEGAAWKCKDISSTAVSELAL